MASATSLNNSTVHRLQVEEVEVADRKAKVPVAPDAGPVQHVAPPSRTAIVLGALDAIARVLAVRFLLLLSVVGAFVLASMAMASQSPMSLSILCAYAALTVIPLVWLDRTGR